LGQNGGKCSTNFRLSLQIDKLKLMQYGPKVLDRALIWAENAQYPAVPVSLLGLNFSPDAKPEGFERARTI
jgi:hypothetical protein